MTSLRWQRSASVLSWVTRQRRALLLVEPEQQLNDLGAGCCIKVTRGFIRKKISGFAAKARAIATRCCSPPEAFEGNVVNARQAQRAPDNLRPSRASSLPASSSGSMTFSSAVSAGNNWKLWKTSPLLARNTARSSSSSAQYWCHRGKCRPRGTIKPASNQARSTYLSQTYPQSLPFLRA